MTELVWRPSWLNYWKAFLFALVLIVGTWVAMPFISDLLAKAGVTPYVLPLAGFVLALLPLMRAVIHRFRWKYLVKPDGHVAVRHGIIAKDTNEIRVQDIRLLRVEQTIMHRIFGLGDVEIATAGHSEVEIHMRGIRDPEGVKEAIRKLQGILTESDE
ncbi:MAG: PH domain-containing protein [Planctomycetes bacterium]|nr:PH domain-containing protein [Planctomycetota bacterium]